MAQQPQHQIIVPGEQPLYVTFQRYGKPATWLPLAVAFIALAVWYLLTRDNTNAFIVAPPLKVASQFLTSLGDGSLLANVGTTLSEIGIGLLFGVGSAFVLGCGIAKSKVLEQAIGPYAVGFQAVPIVAIAPVLIRFLGPGLLTNGMISAFVVFFPMLVSTIVGLRSVDPDLREMMRALKATPWQTFTRLELPAAMPILFGGLKISTILAVVGTVVGEAVSSQSGLGFLIYYARYTYDTSLVYVGIFTLTALALALYEIVTRLERRTLPWQHAGH